MISVALALAFAGIGRPPINPPGADCPKGWIFKRGECWRRTVDDKSVFLTPEDEQAEEDFYRWIDGQLDRRTGKARR